MKRPKKNAAPIDPKTRAAAVSLVERLAVGRHVERLIANICGGPSFDLFDLSQIVYLSLLEDDARKLLHLDEVGELDYFLVRVIKNQYRSNSSPWYRQCRLFGARTVEIGTASNLKT